MCVWVVLIALAEVGRPARCGWHHSLGRDPAVCTSGEHELSATKHTFIALCSWPWCHVTNCFKSLLPWRPQNDGLYPGIVRKRNPFSIKLLLLGYSATESGNKTKTEINAEEKTPPLREKSVLEHPIRKVPSAETSTLTIASHTLWHTHERVPLWNLIHLYLVFCSWSPCYSLLKLTPGSPFLPKWFLFHLLVTSRQMDI